MTPAVKEASTPGRRSRAARPAKQREGRARPPGHARIVDQHGILGRVSRLDKLVELFGHSAQAVLGHQHQAGDHDDQADDAH